MSSLADFFSEEERQKFSDRVLEVGTVVRMHVNDTIPPKIKFWVIIGIKDDSILGVVYFNSEVNSFVRSNPRLNSVQVLIKANNGDMFDHDCYADCSKIMRKSKNEIEQALKNNPEMVRGKLSTFELTKIQAAIVQAPTIDRVTKQDFGLL